MRRKLNKIISDNLHSHILANVRPHDLSFRFPPLYCVGESQDRQFLVQKVWDSGD